MTATRKIVGLTGVAGAGKSTVAQILVKRHGFTLVKFAEPLKAMLRALYAHCGLDVMTIERKIEGDLKHAPCEYLLGKTPREAMQTIGTEWGREQMDPALWVTMFKYRVLASPGDVVADDCRFLNEADMIHYLGGAVWSVSGRVAIGTPAHVSETEQREMRVDARLDNSGTLTDLQTQVDTLVFG